MLKTNWLKEKLTQSDEACIGTWITTPSIDLTDLICSAGLDFVVIDSEHAPISFETAQHMAMACEARGTSPMLRIPGVDESYVLKGLEIGSHGLQVPNLGSAEDLERLVQFAKYPPIGQKGLSPFTRACDYYAANATKMTEVANANTLLSIHIEGEAGVNNIDSMLEVEGIDIYFLGLFDLSKYLGIPGQVDHPDLLGLFTNLVGKINASGKIAGAISNSEAQLNHFIEAGVRYITHSADCNLIRETYNSIMKVKNR